MINRTSGLKMYNERKKEEDIPLICSFQIEFYLKKMKLLAEIKNYFKYLIKFLFKTPRILRVFLPYYILFIKLR